MSAAVAPFVQRATPAEWDQLGRIERVLSLAYSLRPCFDCGKRERCPHREPQLERVIAKHIGIGAETWAL